jgi:hypothetical protein
VPVPLDQIPADVRSRLGLAAGRPSSSQPEAAKSPAEVERQPADIAPPIKPPSMTVEQVEALKALNDAAIQAQIAPVRIRILEQLQARGLSVQYASELAPIIYLQGVTRFQLEELARLPEIDAIYDASIPGGPSLAIAGPTQNADMLDDVGYDGSGVSVAVVEGERIFTGNPFLSVAGSRDGSFGPRAHPTGVGGIIRSTHPSVRGLAPGVTLYSANGDNYQTIGALSTALDWGSTQASVLNNSFWAQSNGSDANLYSLDRHIDYIARYLFDFSAVASGNFRVAGCGAPGSPATNYVATPGKGYNALTVGNYDDNNTLGWPGDFMNACSSYNSSGRYKPEVAAVGSSISSTLSSTVTFIGPIGSGTSYASPMVAALAADLIEANSDLSNEPETLRSILMATALHNVEGDARLSRLDGAGGIDATAAIATAERLNTWNQFVDSAADFPITYTMFVYQGERVRFVVNWLSNPDAAYTTDPLPADLDLIARRANGTVISGSLSVNNNFEIVDFIAPASETYQFVVTHFSSDWSSGGTWLGAAGWRGTYRVFPNTGYSDPQASPLGTHLSVHPIDWSPTSYWRAFGIRSLGTSDHDLTLNTASWFDDPATRSFLANSAYGAGEVDFTVVDGNHRLSVLPEHYRVYRFAGSGGYDLSWSNLGISLLNPGLYGPYSMDSSEVVKVFDVRFTAGETRRISVIPTSGTNDLAVELFRSDGGSPATWTQGRSESVASADAYGIGMDIERLKHTASSSDWLGLVVFTRNQASASFYILVEDLKVFLPVVLKND